jgi:hypothetical protein
LIDSKNYPIGNFDYRFVNSAKQEVTDMNKIRWIDKVYLDSQGNIRSSDGCPTDQISQDLINKIISNVGLAQDTKQ